MGGIGKTTLAEEIFNKLQPEYEASYFLANEREQSSKHEIISLKEEIFSELLGDVKIGTPNSLPNDIIRRIGRKKVFVVLDDVNNSDHLEILLGPLDNFGSGSRIIVTTRDKQVLKAKKADEIYQLREFSFDEALELFNVKAFNQRDHQREYNVLSIRLVTYAKGIPLVLKVLAQLLHGKNKEVWESELNKLERMPLTEVYDVLKLSYDDLDRREQQIFLDLACFFLRLHEKVNVSHLKSLLKDGESDNSVIVGLERLKDKALIAFSEDDFVSKHDSIQEMALEIVRRDDLKSLSWLWDSDGICEAMENEKAIETIRSMQVPWSWWLGNNEQKFSPHVFAKMNRVRFLEIYGEYRHCCFDHFLATELRFLHWFPCPLKFLPEKISAKKLVILKLPGCKMVKLWHGVKNLVNLKELDLSKSKMLKELPDLSKATNLEVINLSGCNSLTSVHPSIFSLGKCDKLDLWQCTSLTILASDSYLCNLSYLNLDGCWYLREFSLISENMKELRLQDTRIKALPSSFEHQCKLKSLHPGRCIERLPSSFSNLTQLLHLEVIFCEELQTIPELPPLLETLDIKGCKSVQTIGKLPPSLKTLDVSWCESLQSLPELPLLLETLGIEGCKSIQTIGNLPPSLKTLDFRFCYSLERLPKLPHFLETIDTRGCKSLQTLLELPHFLETIDTRGCECLQTLPELPPSLKTLDVSSCDSLESLPELPLLLETLCMTKCTSLRTIGKLPPSLKTLDVCDCHLLQSLPELPPSLETLGIKGYKLLQTIGNLPPSLKTLHVSSCKSLQSLPDLPPLLETLDTQHCNSLQTMGKLPQFLKILDVSWCESLQNLPELPLLLETLWMIQCTSLQTIGKLPPSLKALHVSSCESLQSLPELPLSLEILYVTNCESLKTVLLPSTAVEQLKENRKQFLLLNCWNLDEHSLVAIGLNVRINVMKFANHEKYNVYSYKYFCFHYPGSSVPEWLEYKTTKDYIIIDLSSAPPFLLLSFIFCFVLGKNHYDVPEVNININDGEGKGKKESVRMNIGYLSGNLISDHVCVMYDQRCSDFLNSRAKKKKRLDNELINHSPNKPLIKGFGFSPISTLAYKSFIQEMESHDSMCQFH